MGCEKSVMDNFDSTNRNRSLFLLSRTPIALAAALLLLTVNSHAQQTPPPAKAAVDRNAPLVLQADEIRGRPDLELEAIGNVRLERGPLRMTTDRLGYDSVADRVQARGNVRIDTAPGDWFAGRELSLTLGRFEGFFLEPEYFFSRTQAGGHAKRIDFIGPDRALLTGADYTSCDRSGSGTPAWLMSTTRVRLDFDANEGIAEGAVLRFMGVPILAAPVLSFPLSDERKTGWLPPTINLDNKSGLELGVPWYWNIAPQRDATFTPTVYSRRGFALTSEFRYLQPSHQGEVEWHWLPNDRTAGESRHAVQWKQRGVAFDGTIDNPGNGWRWQHEGLRASDDNYWKDFPRALRWITPRLLPLAGEVAHDSRLGAFDTTAYARVQYWQVLQDTDPLAQITAPYDRAPQLGWRGTGSPGNGLVDLAFEAEFNRFVLTRDSAGPARPDGQRAHLLAEARRTWRTPGTWFTPRVAINLAHYRTDSPMSDGRTSASRAIPTLSLDGGMIFERSATWFGRALTQTLEPRVLYINTPYRAQDTLPLFDTAAKDFNPISVFSDNAFSGIDRVTDAHQVTAGVTSRWIDPASGAEALRLGIAQRYLLRDQRITPDSVPLTQRFSDILLAGTANLTSKWSFDAGVQYSPEIDRITRSTLSARWSPGAFRTLSATYRLTRGASETLDLGWQWPLYRADPQSAAGKANGCRGTLYGVGRINYSMKDSRITDSLAGLEYDAGCWIARVVSERLSTGRTEATTRLLFQLELVGLSRLGSNPLQALKDNIPGYTLLREDRSDPPVRTYISEGASATSPAR
jgi:LPS-assembly protein